MSCYFPLTDKGKGSENTYAKKYISGEIVCPYVNVTMVIAHFHSFDLKIKLLLYIFII